MELVHQELLLVPEDVGNSDPKLCCSYIFETVFSREWTVSAFFNNFSVYI